MGPLSKWGIIGEHARDELIRLAGVNYKAECDMQVKDMRVKELSDNVYLKVKGIIEGAYIIPLAREVKVNRSREGEAAGPLDVKLTNAHLSLQLRGRA